MKFHKQMDQQIDFYINIDFWIKKNIKKRGKVLKNIEKHGKSLESGQFCLWLVPGLAGSKSMNGPPVYPVTLKASRDGPEPRP